MPMLKVRCVNCAKMMPTGLDLTSEEFKELTYSARQVQCRECGERQTWTMDDVDLSVFGKLPA